jgi:DNA-binding transcriptional ArsR family regulator
MLNAVDEMATWTRSKIWAIKNLMHDTVKYVQVALPKVYKRELVELLFVQPYVRIGDLVDAGLGTRKTVAGHLNQLIAAGVLREEKEGRDKLFINVRFFDLLMSDSNEFAPFPSPAPAA